METKTEVNPTNTGASTPDTAAQFLHKAKKATRRRFSAEDKIRIVIEGMKRENERLKTLIADQVLALSLFKKSLTD